LLAHHFTRLHGERLQRPGVGLDPVALRALTTYDWPGNIRQLSNAIERALVLGDGEWIRPEDLPEELLDARPTELGLGDFQTVLTETKKRLLLDALAQAEGNAAAAARQLGLHPNSFRRLMRQLGLREGHDT
ncbi:MAG: sigma-54-dependent Fis family transcriptional regulator, partial [Acidobacteria bacterium]|nr:sigma-54-dependent Fis family transcriptional regulator [Acidobacteriota bacterium]